MPKGCIIYCIERGALEKHTLLSIASIRRYGGFLNDYNIYCVQPRKEFPIKKSTETQLSNLGVNFINKPINTRHRYYSIANKPLAINYIMKNFDYDQYIFLDGDTLIVDEPKEFLISNFEFLLSPVYTKGIGMSDLEDKNAGYWKKVFKLSNADLNDLPTITTLFESDEIISYWNAGIMVINGLSKLILDWEKLMILLLEKRIYSDPGIFFIEQSALAATLISKKVDPGKLSLSHNFPLSEKVFKSHEFTRLNQLCVIHHLDHLDLLESIPASLLGEEKKQWILNQSRILKINHGVDEKMRDTYYSYEKKIKERLYYFIYKFTNRNMQI